MSEKPFALVQIDDTVRHLRSAMRKTEAIPRSMTRQLCGMLSHYLRKRLAGHNAIHPGMAKMATWGECSDRQARENFRRLKFYGVVTITEYEKGGRRASRFVMSVEAICRFLVTIGANPSKPLIEKLRTFRNPEENPEVNPEVRGGRNPEENPEATSAGILYKGTTPENVANVVAFPVAKRAAGGF